MSSVEGIEQVTQAVDGITIDGPQNNGPLPARHNPSIESQIAAARADIPRAPDALEEQLEEEMGGDTTVRISGPDGTTGKEAVDTVVKNALGGAAEPALFDNTVYVDVPVIDGQATDKLEVAFNGKISYDASDEDGKALFAKLLLGGQVELRVAGVVAGKTGAYKVTARDEEVVTGKATIKVDTLYLLSPEAL